MHPVPFSYFFVTQPGNRNFGPSLPLSVDTASQGGDTTSTITNQSVQETLQGALANWQALGSFSSIVMPDGGAGNNLGEGFFPAGLQLDHVIAEQIQSLPSNNRIAGFGQSRLDDQSLLADFDTILADSGHITERIGMSILGNITADELSVNGYSPTPSDRHAVQPETDTLLRTTEESAITDATYKSDESWEAKNGTAVDNSAISVASLDVGSQSSSLSRNGSGSDHEILKLQEVPLVGLTQQPAFLGQGRELVGADILATFSTPGYDQDQQEQSALQHNLSFGSHTLPPDWDGVNYSHTLSAEQLELLSRATVTIADLADGYLALTLVTTITLDIDAAGYGWFIDQTPFLNEEWRPRETSNVKGETSGSSHSPLATDYSQLSADPAGHAAGKIDLLTVLMHELGHVMGLGHVSSAVDGTRLMAGSIDPGVRRLPSVLDLGPASGQWQLASGSGESSSDSDHSPLEVWAPYRTHYTTTQSSAIGTSQPSTSALASTLWAAHTPSHVGIFNPNFAISHQPSADFGWDLSGAVTIANGQAVLSEDNNVISTLSQAFTLPAGSTHLRFTLVDVNLVRTGTMGTGTATVLTVKHVLTDFS